MKICFFANINSKSCRNWIMYFLSKEKRKEYEVHVISPYPLQDSRKDGVELDGAHIHIISLFGQRGRSVQDTISATSGEGKLVNKIIAKLKVRIVQFMGRMITSWWSQVRMLTLRKQITQTLKNINPDVVHALRLFQEGEMAGLAGWRPLIISIWGQDLIIDARISPLHGWLARNALRQTAAVTADNKRDLDLAFDWGRQSETPGELFLASGGIRPDIFYSSKSDDSILHEFDLDPESIVILSPRGLRPGFIRLNTLFEAIPKVTKLYSNVKFVQFEIPNYTIAADYGLSSESMPFVRLIRRSTQNVLAELMRRSTLMVSPAFKDGTPNSLFESMACGAVPIVPNISPYPEWFTDGENGFFFNPFDSESLAKAIIRALNNNELLEQARQINFDIVDKFASRNHAMARAETLYRSIVPA